MYFWFLNILGELLNSIDFKWLILLYHGPIQKLIGTVNYICKRLVASQRWSVFYYRCRSWPYDSWRPLGSDFHVAILRQLRLNFILSLQNMIKSILTDLTLRLVRDHPLPRRLYLWQEIPFRHVMGVFQWLGIPPSQLRLRFLLCVILIVILEFSSILSHVLFYPLLSLKIS